MDTRNDVNKVSQSTPEHPATMPPGAAFQPLREAVKRHPLQFALGLAGLGLTLALLARRRTH